uniref:Ig-like domain-containing protein n=1 Tax=Terrapene triunguis TaxID=2587831 RepID=A0A674J1X7_9SAUR
CRKQVWCFPGFQAQFFDAMESRVEGQSLVVVCRYSIRYYSGTEKAWCQQRGEKCSPIVNTSYTSYGYQTKVTSGRAMIEDDTRNGIITITMEKLQVQDSGVYWCALYYPPNTLFPLKTIKLDVFKGELISFQENFHIHPSCNSAEASEWSYTREEFGPLCICHSWEMYVIVPLNQIVLTSFCGFLKSKNTMLWRGRVSLSSVHTTHRITKRRRKPGAEAQFRMSVMYWSTLTTGTIKTGLRKAEPGYMTTARKGLLLSPWRNYR